MNQHCDTAAVLADETILDLYFERDEAAISATDRKYRPYLYTIAYNIVRDEGDSEECLDDTYLHTWNSIPPTRPSILRVFLAKLTRNTATDRYRKNTADRRIPSELLVSLEELDDCLPTTPSPDEELRMKELCRVLNDFLRALGERERLLFICRYYYADRIKDIAAALGVSDRTVYRELQSLRLSLREHLTKEGIRL